MEINLNAVGEQFMKTFALQYLDVLLKKTPTPEVQQEIVDLYPLIPKEVESAILNMVKDLIYKEAHRHATTSVVAFEDLVQQGNLIAMLLLRDKRQREYFSKVLLLHLETGLARYVKLNYSSVSISTYGVEKNKELMEFIVNYKRVNSVNPSPEEVMTALNMSPSSYFGIYGASKMVKEDFSSLKDQPELSTIDNYFTNELRDTLSRTMDKVLSEREREVLDAIYFNEVSRDDIALKWGQSRDIVCRTERVALRKLSKQPEVAAYRSA